MNDSSKRGNIFLDLFIIVYTERQRFTNHAFRKQDTNLSNIVIFTYYILLHYFHNSFMMIS